MLTSFCAEVTLNSYLRFLEFFRVKAFDWKISYWTFCCTVLVSILSCLFVWFSSPVRQNIGLLWIFSNTSLQGMSWFIQSKPSFLWETQPEPKAVSTIPPGIRVSGYILIKIKRELRLFKFYFVVILSLLTFLRLKKSECSWLCY